MKKAKSINIKDNYNINGNSNKKLSESFVK